MLRSHWHSAVVQLLALLLPRLRSQLSALVSTRDMFLVLISKRDIIHCLYCCQVALKSDENTTVELRAPEGFVDSLQQSTELSLFFQTEKENGLLLYIGPKAATTALRAKRQTAALVVSCY